MKKLKIDLKILIYLIFSSIFFCLFAQSSYSNDISFEIQGNDFTDTNVILSLLDEIPDEINKESSNDIIKALSESNLFSNVLVKFENNKYVIVVTEYPNIDKIYFKKNDRLEDDELMSLVTELKLTT